MKEFTVKRAERGQRFEKYIKRKLPEASVSFIYKMLRKKNITLNGHKAQGTETVEEGDRVVFFLSDETFDKFSAPQSDTDSSIDEYIKAYEKIKRQYPELSILYENSEVLFLVKPSGLLSQKAAPSDISVNEWLNGYLLSSDNKISANNKNSIVIKNASDNKAFAGEKGSVENKAFAGKKENVENKAFAGKKENIDKNEKKEKSVRNETGYHPSAVNRLDRNTGGIVICAKTLYGSRVMSELLREKSRDAKEKSADNDTIHKYYAMIVSGKTPKSGTIEGWIKKNEADNKVSVFDKNTEGASYSKTKYRTLKYNDKKDLSLIEAELITGRTHQLRAHFACLGHPIIGDVKYGSDNINRKFRKDGALSQLLFCRRLEMPLLGGELADLSHRTIEADLPAVFNNVMK